MAKKIRQSTSDLRLNWHLIQNRNKQTKTYEKLKTDTTKISNFRENYIIRIVFNDHVKDSYISFNNAVLTCLICAMHSFLCCDLVDLLPNND